MKKIYAEGHRGACALYPENTLLSFQKAMEMGVDAIEFDIWLTSDKVPVLMHDGSAYRTCGVDKNLRDMTLTEVKTLCPSCPKAFGNQFQGQVEVPTLYELLELQKKLRPDLKLGVEIKEYTEETVDLSVAILKEFGLFDKACFYAFDAPTIQYLKTKYGARTMGYPDFQMKRLTPDVYDYYDELGLGMQFVRSEIYGLYPPKGFPIHLYCADTEEDVDACLAKAECVLITANDPVALMKKLGRVPGETKDY